VNALKEKARRALYAIKRTFYNIQIPIKIWCKIFDDVIEPIALCGSDVWGPLGHHGDTRWDKHPTEGNAAISTFMPIKTIEGREREEETRSSYT